MEGITDAHALGGLSTRAGLFSALCELQAGYACAFTMALSLPLPPAPRARAQVISYIFRGASRHISGAPSSLVKTINYYLLHLLHWFKTRNYYLLNPKFCPFNSGGWGVGEAPSSAQTLLPSLSPADSLQVTLWESLRAHLSCFPSLR